MSSATASIRYGDAELTYRVGPPRPEGKKLLIKVLPEGEVLVHPPAGCSERQIAEAVRQRARWIWRQLSAARENNAHVLPRRYVSGESHFYLGRRYLLKIAEEPGAAAAVKLLRGRLNVQVRDRSPQKVRAALENWYRIRAREVFERRLDAVLPQTLWLASRPKLRLLTMRTQWGSCSPGGSLTLNPHLVKAPRECIDYVLVHELCHLAEHNHSDRFYRLLTQVMPDWQPIKQRLDRLAAELLNGIS